MTSVRDQIEQFRLGKRFRGPAEDYLVDGRPDQQVLDKLDEALDRYDEVVGEPVVHMLVAMGQAADPTHDKGGTAFRHPGIVSILVHHGLTRPGAVRDAALEALQQHVPPDVLAEHGDALAETLDRWPDGVAFLAVAKAKPPKAVHVVNRLMKDAEWADDENAKIAKAALGDANVEKEYINRFLATHEPDEKAHLAHVLGYMGTPKALHALAGEMRTDLVGGIVMAFDRSVRLDILNALSYNFPDNPVLYEQLILTDDDYARVEAFCEQEFGITWTRPRPEFLTVQGYPSGE